MTSAGLATKLISRRKVHTRQQSIQDEHARHFKQHKNGDNDVDDNEEENRVDLLKDRLNLVDCNRIVESTNQAATLSQAEFAIPFRSIAVVTATTQISSLVFCLAWSVKFNFYESTATHCRVANYLPSLSATLDFTPQRDIWRTCIGLSGVPRYFIAYLYYKLIFNSTSLLWLHWIEITALIGLSIVDSIRYFGKCVVLSGPIR